MLRTPERHEKTIRRSFGSCMYFSEFVKSSGSACSIEAIAISSAGRTSMKEKSSPASIHAFTTELGDQHLKGAVDTYFTAIDDGRYTYTQTNRVVPFSEVYPGLPAVVWEDQDECLDVRAEDILLT